MRWVVAPSLPAALPWLELEQEPPLLLEAVRELVANRADKASSPKEASESADAIVTILPDDDTVEQVAAGKDGVLEGMSEGAILVDMSTISPTMARRIAERLEANGMEMLDAPVSGGEIGAIEGSLSIMVGRKQEVFIEFCRFCKEWVRILIILVIMGQGR